MSKVLKDNRKFSKEIEEQLITHIMLYPTLYKSHLSLLSSMLIRGTGVKGWVNGRIVDHDYNKDEKQRLKKPEVSRQYATHILYYGCQNHFCSFSGFYKNGSYPICTIPKNIADDWLNVISDFLYEVNRINMDAYKIQLLAYCIQQYGTHSINNPHIYTHYDSHLKYFQELRIFTNQLAKDLGCKYNSVDHLQDPNYKVELEKNMSKLVREILDSADGIVPKAYEAISKQDASVYIRRFGKDTFKEIIKEMEETNEYKT